MPKIGSVESVWRYPVKSMAGEALAAAGVLRPLLTLGLTDVFIEHGDPVKLLALQGLDSTGICASIRARFGAHCDGAAPVLKIVV